MANVGVQEIRWGLLFSFSMLLLYELIYNCILVMCTDIIARNQLQRFASLLAHLVENLSTAKLNIRLDIYKSNIALSNYNKGLYFLTVFHLDVLCFLGCFLLFVSRNFF